jgi:NifB/MoaA-like Fe-S oxidoreductase
LTGEDIANAVKEYQKAGGAFDEILLPSSVLKEFEEVFLCGMTLQGLKDRLHFENIRINQEGGYGLIDILAKEKE